MGHTSARSAPAVQRIVKWKRRSSRAGLYVDSREAALVEAGDIVLAMNEGIIGAAHIKGELGEVVPKPGEGRSPADTRVTIFKSLGLAVEDVAAAHLVHQRALDAGRGMEFVL